MIKISLASYLSLAVFVILNFTILNGQTIEASNENTISLQKKGEADMEFEKEDYRALISSQYLVRFSEFKQKLEKANSTKSRISRNIGKQQEKLSSSKSQIEKQTVKDNISLLKEEDNKITEEIKLIKKGLKSLQENKTKSDPVKLNILNDLNEIEKSIILLDERLDSKKSKRELSKIDIDDTDVYMSVRNNDCKIIFDGVDKQSKKQRKEVAQEFLFGYTHPKLKSYFKEKHFLTGEAQMVQLNNKNYLLLHITISSKDAIKNYGEIEKNSALKIELLDGDILYAGNANDSKGTLEPYTGNTKYMITLPLDKSKIKQLEKSEIDKIGVMWSSGYEQYEVMHVDIVMNQINCLNNK